jgi:hypothetical protein
MKEVSAQVKLTKGTDGIWLHISTAQGRHASFHIGNTFNRGRLADTAMREWAENQFYLEEGDKCPQPGCNGIMGYEPVENCSCHINPPCSRCEHNPLVCLECGNGEDDQ